VYNEGEKKWKIHMDIAIALGGGGAKGNTHIGVLRALEREGFRIRAVAGTSFGGMVAVFYAMGCTPNVIEDIFSSFDQSRLYGHTFGEQPSLLGIEGGRKWLEEHLGERTFDDLYLPCVVTATDLKSGSEIILSEGRLVDAILATTAIPGVFPARMLGDWELVDGGVLDPVPVAPARSLAPRLPVVAVVLNDPIGIPAVTWSIPVPRFVPQSLVERLSKSRLAQSVDVILRSYDIVSRAAAHYRLEVDHPAIIIRPEVSDIDMLSQVDVREIAFRGEVAVEKVIPELKRMFAWYNRVRRRVSM
jgi:NTE family protein